MAMAAHEAELPDQFVEGCHEYYPALVEVIERLLPTYPRHAARRGQEMTQVEATMDSLDLKPGLVRETRRLLVRLGKSNLDEQAANARPGTLEEWIDLIAVENPLRRAPNIVARGEEDLELKGAV
jgi:hypothetical protein